MLEPLGLILAGGNGTRMGDVIKADLRLRGRRLLDHVEGRLAPQVREVAISANVPLETGMTVLPDADDKRLGPLAGILAGMTWAKTRGATHVVSAAVDTPFLPCDLVPRLILAAEPHPHGLAVAATSDGQHGTFAIWPVALHAGLSDFLSGGGRKVRAFLEGNDACVAPFPETDPPAFFNINTPDDLARAEAWL